MLMMLTTAKIVVGVASSPSEAAIRLTMMMMPVMKKVATMTMTTAVVAKETVTAV
jgi:hypothetical protein